MLIHRPYSACDFLLALCQHFLLNNPVAFTFMFDGILFNTISGSSGEVMGSKFENFHSLNHGEKKLNTQNLLDGSYCEMTRPYTESEDFPVCDRADEGFCFG